MKTILKSKSRRGFITPIIELGVAGITVAAVLYCGAVWLLLEGIKAMPDVSPYEKTIEDTER